MAPYIIFDEDAYILLDNYLNNLRYHFRKDEGAEEIVRDIESRIAELFDEALRGGLQVITIKRGGRGNCPYGKAGGTGA